MAKILYGVAGEGFGHSSRSHLTAEKLLQAGHSVMFAASNKSYRYLKQYFPSQVTAVHGLTFTYKDTSIAMTRTLVDNLAASAKMVKTNYKAFTKTYPGFCPDLVITDFEPFTSFWAFINNIPCLSIDHEHLLSKFDYEKPKTKLFARLSSNSITKNYLLGVNEHIVLNFFQAIPLESGVKLVNPIIRNTALKYKPGNNGDFILIYATNDSCLKKFYELAIQMPKEKFRIYGSSKTGIFKNCEFKSLSSENFLQDLSQCKGVMATGGFSLISECLHFQKKMFVKPIDKQIEQMTNAYHLAKMGGGMYVNHLNRHSLQTFLDWLEEPYQIDTDHCLAPDNEQYFAILSESLERLSSCKVSLRSVLKNNQKEVVNYEPMLHEN